MIYVIGLAVLAFIVYGIVRVASGDRYSKLSEKEFDAEAKRSSLMGSAMIGVQKTLDPHHSVEHVQEQKQRAEPDGARSGDAPETGNKGRQEGSA
jgi:hypothetical protein